MSIIEALLVEDVVFAVEVLVVLFVAASVAVFACVPAASCEALSCVLPVVDVLSLLHADSKAMLVTPIKKIFFIFLLFGALAVKSMPPD